MAVSAQVPVFNSALVGATYAVGDTAAAFNGTAAVADGGTISYQWQSSTNGSSWADIAGATGATFTPPTTSGGTKYYRVIAKNTYTSPGLQPKSNLYPSSALYPVSAGTTFTATATSNTAGITVVGASAPVFNAELTSSDYDMGALAAALNGTATAPYGTISYQWQSSANGSSWADVTGATGATFTPPTTSGGTKYYRVIAKNTVGTTTATSASGMATITVYTATVPTFQQPLVSAGYNIGVAAAALNGAATAIRGSLSYQWYSSGDGSTWTAISGATSSNFTPPTGTGGVKFYRMTAKNVVGTDSKSATSDSARIEVFTATAPVFSSSLISSAYNAGDSVSALNGAATAPRGTIAYQWYKDGVAIVGATGATYTPSSASAGANGYTVKATNTVGTSTQSATSNAATITIYGAIAPTFSLQPISVGYIENDPASVLAVSATVIRGGLSYQWQKSADEATWENVPGATGTTILPQTANPGVEFFRCMAENSVGTDRAGAYSSAAKITVTAAQVPRFLSNLIPATYKYADVAQPLNGAAYVTDGGLITYQWEMSADEGTTWATMPGATGTKLKPSTVKAGTAIYRVTATNTLHSSRRASTSNTAQITVIDTHLNKQEQYMAYLAALKGPFIKLARLRFLNPDGSTAFTLDNNPLNRRSGAFIQDGTLTVNLQNGQRRQASVTISNLDNEFDFNVNTVWFGQQIALDEGMILPNGDEYYFPQGVFYISNPQEVFMPGRKTVTYNLVDKWAYLDGSLFGNLHMTYEVPVGSPIFSAMATVLGFDRGNGYPVDRVTPIFTEFYNGKTTKLPNGSTVSLTVTPFTLRIDSDSGTYADVALGLSDMLTAWIGYDQTGRLRVDPSQNDILDTSKPILYQFSPKEVTFLGATYTVKNTEVFNDIIVLGEKLDNNKQPSGRAQNLDPTSDTNVFSSLGRRTKRIPGTGFGTDLQCRDLAVWRLKRQTVLQKSIDISCQQMFHITENNLVTLERTDKPGSPVERHLIQGFSRPIGQTGQMKISCTSVSDYPAATITSWPE